MSAENNSKYELKHGSVVNNSWKTKGSLESISVLTHDLEVDSQSEGSQNYEQVLYGSTSTENGMHPDRKKMKQERNRRTEVGDIGGCVVGGLALGPMCAVVGVGLGAAVTKKICKAGEKRPQRKWVHYEAQIGWRESIVHQGFFV